MRKIAWTIAAAFVALAPLCVAQANVPASPFRGTYEIYNSPAGFTNISLTGINNLGVMAGSGFDPAVGASVSFIDDHGIITRLAVPSASRTGVTKLNDNGDAVGTWYDANGAAHGYLYSGGAYTTFDFPGARTTIPNGINGSGVIAGTYQNPDYAVHGFLRFPDGTMTTFDDPNTGQGVEDINDKGHIAGTFFLYVDGKFYDKWDATYRQPENRGLNNKDQTVGVGYFGDVNALRGFFKADNEYFVIDPPLSNETIAYDVNDSGVVVGWFLSYQIGSHGFIARPSK